MIKQGFLNHKNKNTSDGSTSLMGAASKGSDVVGDSVSAPSITMLQDDGNSQGGSIEAEKVGFGDDVSSPLHELGSLLPRDDNMEQLPNQGKPVSLGNVGNIIIDNDKVVLDDVEQLHGTYDSNSTSKGSKQPNVEQLFANANQNFDDVMNKIQREIGAEANFTSNPLSSATSGSPKVGTTNGTGVKLVYYAGATSNEQQKHVSNFRRLECSKKKVDVDLSVPMKVVEEVNTRFQNTLYGYFLGQRLAFPVVDYFVRNAWAKFGVQKVMMNAKGSSSLNSIRRKVLVMCLKTVLG
jgi:hypothetical protein